jgi:putative transposase
MTGMHRRSTPRCPNFDYLGFHRYSLTFCTFDRKVLFAAEPIVSTVLSHFLRAAERDEVEILAYCFMPDHVHLLVAGTTAQSDARRFIAAAKQFSGHWYRQQFSQPLWQRSAWDRIVRTEDNTETVIRYLLMNPVRAGIVSDPLDYPFSGSLVYSRDVLMDAFR